MKKRHESREQAFVLLFEKTVSGSSMEDIIEAAIEARCIEMDPYCEKLTGLAELYMDEIDEVITKHIRGWSLRRLSKVTLSILRLAVCEIKFLKAEDVPVSVSINEAVELIKQYDDEKTKGFVNGVLNAVKEEIANA